MKAEQKFTVGIVGLGRIAWSDHIPGFLKHPGFEIVAVVDPLAERGRESCGKFGIPRYFTELSDLLRSPVKPDVVVIASPTVFHADQAVAALQAGCHVFCDKPAAVSAAEFERMRKAAQQNNRRLMVFQPRRFSANSFAIREILSSGKLGALYGVKLFIGNFVFRTDWQAWKKNGGGMLFNYGAHYIDQVRYLLNEKLRFRSASARSIASMGDADDVVKILLRSESGIDVDIDINQAAGIVPFVWELFGTRGAALLRSFGGDWQLRYFSPEDMPEIVVEKELAATGRNYPHQEIAFRNESVPSPRIEMCPIDFYVKNWYGMLTGQEAPVVPVEDTSHVMELIESCSQDAGV